MGMSDSARKPVCDLHFGFGMVVGSRWIRDQYDILLIVCQRLWHFFGAGQQHRPWFFHYLSLSFTLATSIFRRRQWGWLQAVCGKFTNSLAPQKMLKMERRRLRDLLDLFGSLWISFDLLASCVECCLFTACCMESAFAPWFMPRQFSKTFLQELSLNCYVGSAAHAHPTTSQPKGRFHQAKKYQEMLGKRRGTNPLLGLINRLLVNSLMAFTRFDSELASN